MNNKTAQKRIEEDVIKDPIEHLIEHRIPWLIIGLLGGLLTTVIISKYEVIIASDVRLVFFIPIIVYLSDAVGTQTETIFVRELSEGKINIKKYIFKENLIGLSLGIISGIIFWFFSTYWLGSYEIGMIIGLTMIINLTLAPVFAVLIPSILYKKHSDPALGSGPVATIIQDLVSLLIYFYIASIILF